MTTEHEFEKPKNEQEIPGSLYVGPEMLTALEQTSRGEPLTWGATPLNPYRQDVADQQTQVRHEISEFFPKSAKEVPYNLDWDTARYIEDNYTMRTLRRISRNFDSYQNRGKFNVSEVPFEALGFVDRSLTGHASPTEIIATADIQQIATIELGSLSIPYGQRIEDHLKPMRNAVREAILFYHGELLDSKPEYKVRSANYFTNAYKAVEPSLLMTRTTDVGKIGEDIVIPERSSFVVVLSRLVPEMVEKIKKIQYSKTWSTEIISLDGFMAAVEGAIDTNNYGSVVPISTTTVEVNSRLVKELLEDPEHIRNRIREISNRALLSSGHFLLLNKEDK